MLRKNERRCERARVCEPKYTYGYIHINVIIENELESERERERERERRKKRNPQKKPLEVRVVKPRKYTHIEFRLLSIEECSFVIV